jgi:hypothetical protein
MVPPILIRQLARLRWRERLLRFVWAVTLGITIAAGVMAVLCLVDWIFDRYEDTPMALRRAMFLCQVILWAALAIILLSWAFMRRVSDTDLALWVEDHDKSFDHRLISALQLNKPDANTRGMSAVLIAAVTRQAEEHAAQVNFGKLADHSRLERATKLAMVAGSVLLITLVFWHQTIAALVARQFLADREIPRSIALESVTRSVWPSGEEVVLRFRVRGALHPAMQGEVRIDPNQEPNDKHAPPSEYYPLVFETQTRESPGEAIFTARVRASTIGYHYRAWLSDGRSRRPNSLRLEPRPAIVKQEAWVRLPAYTGLRPDGQPYELYQPRGDVAGLPGTTARVVIHTQKPIVTATVELYGRPAPELRTAIPGPWASLPGVPLASMYSWLVPLGVLTADGAPIDEADPKATSASRTLLGAELPLRKLAMKIDATKEKAEGIFDLRPSESVYRIVVKDENDFENLDPPRRSIRLESEEPPVVALLPERLSEGGGLIYEEDDIEGVPVRFQGKFRVAYACSSPYGLGRAFMVYRVNEGDWLPLPLKLVPSSEKTGPFDPRQGAFVNSGPDHEIEFHQIPAFDPLQSPSGTAGGGRFDFKTAGLSDLKVGDKIEYYIEVYDRNPADSRAPGRSETRQKTVVTDIEYLAWTKMILQEQNRLMQLEKNQRGVFTAATPPDEPPSTRPVPRPRPTPPATAFVKSWQIIGPFANTNDGKGFDTAYPPETDKLELGKEYEGLKGKVRWKVHHSPGDKVDLERILSHSDAGVAYAVCWFKSEDVRAVLSTGSDDGIKVWIDRKRVLSKKTRREAVPGEDRTAVTWKVDEDWHELLVKVDNRTASWAFYLEFLDPQTLKPLEGVKFRASPPGEEENRFVREWQLIGPFPNVGDAGRDKELPPETEKVDLDKEYDGIGGKVKWQLHKSETGRIGLDKFFERPFNESNLAYAVCWVKCDKERPAVLATGSDDGIKVWINRKRQIDVGEQREAEPAKDIRKITLNAGWNEILVKVDNRFGRWAFYLEVRDPDSERAMDGVEYRTTPP